MAVKVILKNSTTLNKVPLPTDLDVGELAINANSGSPAIYAKDNTGAIVKMAGVGSLGQYLARNGTALSPSTAGDTIQISAGTAALPGLTPLLDPNTGFWSPGPDQLGVATAGIDRLNVTAAGDVLVGGTLPATPNLKLEADGNAEIKSLNGGQLAGFRNILINGNLTVNQRGLDVATVAVGEYGQDRWKRTAGGMTQIIEEGNFTPGATYTLSGTGITTQQIVAPASGNWTLPDVPTTARLIQLEFGTVATPFERRGKGLELLLCQRYYLVTQISSGFQSGGGNVFNRAPLTWPVPMRIAPAVTLTPGGRQSVLQVLIEFVTSYGGTHSIQSNGGGEIYAIAETVSANAEL